MKRIVFLTALASVAIAGCADNTPGGKAVRARHEHFEEMGDAFKGIDNQLKQPSPDMTKVQADAAKIAELAPQVKDWFPAGSGPQDGKRTHAKAEIWSQQAQFGQAAARLEAAAVGLKAAADSGTPVAVGPAAKTLGAACKNCHDRYKSE